MNKNFSLAIRFIHRAVTNPYVQAIAIAGLGEAINLASHNQAPGAVVVGIAVAALKAYVHTANAGAHRYEQAQQDRENLSFRARKATGTLPKIPYGAAYFPGCEA